jgi:hypothetical protein
MAEQPEAVLVCDKPEATTQIKRLDPDEIESWREFGTLGTLWMSGHLGGLRW